MNITGLDPHSFYTVRLSAFNEAGEGPAAKFTVQTDEDGNFHYLSFCLVLYVCSYCSYFSVFVCLSVCLFVFCIWILRSDSCQCIVLWNVVVNDCLVS